MGGMTGLLLLLWAGVTVGSVVDLQKRIIRGRDCTAEERGYHVFLTLNDKPHCSGSLISDEWILTAAHCWKTEPGWIVAAVFGRNLKSGNKVTLGPGHKIFKKYLKKHDIMLLKIPKRPETPSPVRLPDCSKKPKIGVDTVQIAGYYSTAAPGDNTTVTHKIIGSKPLQCADTKVVKCDWIDRLKQKILPAIFPHLLCFKDNVGEVDITGGDSGGGVVFNDTIYGVAVRSGEIAGAVEADSMDICAKIYKDWIIKTTRITWT